MTIDGARELWARRKDTTEDDDEDTEDTEDAEPNDVDEQSDETEEEVVGKKWLEMLAPDDLIFWVKEVHGDEYLKELAKALTVELAKALPPTPRPPVTAASVVAPAVSAGVSAGGVRRV